MKLIIDLIVLYKGTDDDFSFGSTRKEFEINLVPVVGIEIEDSAWKHPREIKKVTINPDEGYYHLWLVTMRFMSENVHIIKSKCISPMAGESLVAVVNS